MPIHGAAKCFRWKDTSLWFRAATIDQYGSWRKQLTTLRLRPWLPIECGVLDDRRTCTASICGKSQTKPVMARFLKVLVSASEKSANIARACRYEEDLFQLLIQEKKGDEMNKRFIQDFKTLADVLIQETVRHDIGKEFPEIAAYIKGEESNTFTNTLGESITVEVKDCPGETSSMLCKVLDGNENAANLLAAEVHKEIRLEEDFSRLSDFPSLPISELGIWIDPIDSTAEYISGGCVQASECSSSPSSIHQSGLPCVTVLIGAFHRKTGVPVVGVVNRPFSSEDSSTGVWSGKYYWGVCYGDYRMSSIACEMQDEEEQAQGGMRMVELSVEGSGAAAEGKNSRGVVVISGSESSVLRARLSTRYTVVEAPGAGHKQLCVALGEADAYLLTRPTTYRWDACGPHALLSALGGGVVDCRKVMNAAADSSPLPPSHLLDCPGLKEALPSMLDLELRFGLRYGDEDEGEPEEGTSESGSAKWCNKGGIIAYRSPRFLLQLVGTIRQPAGAVTSPV
ncbi:inositol polyphosphate 1-phosphatase [Ischnura elegans]|uniref:inositol polyphosphate 1-phosphatase n=1 Tax=Ischnura elegans TaxID=197161 RepID=UPI001ED8B9D2|nr:inositol polyphosphate 1-phosphatase [Ischnura elegans]